MLKGSAHILADDANAEELDTAKQQNQHDDSSIAGDVNAPEELLTDDPDQIKRRRNSREAAAEHGKAQGSGGETDDTLNGIVE